MHDVRLLEEIGHSRGSYIGSRIQPHNKTLEIGGSYNPIFRRRDGYDLWTVDHDTQEKLVEKYTSAGVEGADRIEAIDFIATDGNLDAAISDFHAGTFNFVLSSHNIEHIPNPIAHLRSVERLLAPNGTYLIVAPDKRGCFDLLRPMNTTGQWLEAFLRPEPFHTPCTRYDCESYSVGNRGVVTWAANTIFDDLQIASGQPLEASVRHISDPATEYWDGHAWCFTPHSMLLMLREIHADGLTKLYPNLVLSDGNGEFVVELVRRDVSSIDNPERIRLLALACREQAEAHLRITIT